MAEESQAPIAETPADSAPATGEPTASPAEGDTATPATPESPEAKKEWLVPGERVQELAGQKKELELRLAELEKNQASQAPQDQSDKLDPEAERMLKAAGFMTKAEIEAQQNALRGEMQLQTDLADLKAKYEDFDSEKVGQFALENMGAKNKQALEAAYIFLNKDKMLEDAKKAAIAAANGVGVAEKATPGGPKAPQGPELKGSSKDMMTQVLNNLRTGGQ